MLIFRNNTVKKIILIFVLNCVLVPFVQSSPWQGQWLSTFGKINFIEYTTGYKETTLLFGNYAKNGFIMGVSVANELHGVFYDAKLKKEGSFIFKLDEKQNSYKGDWYFDDIDKMLKWNGSKVIENKVLPVIGIDRYRNIEGTWDTNFGQLVLSQEEVYVKGEYDTLGKIHAIFNQKNGVIFGFFTNKKRWGLLKFTLNKDKTLFKGQWTWETNAWSNQKWDGKKLDK